MAKVTFDGENKIISILPDVTNIDVQSDLYSEWKLWSEANFLRYETAFISEGGTPIDASGTQFSTSFYFIANGWILKCDTGEDVVIQTNLLAHPETGAANILDMSNNSSIVIEISKAVTIATDGSGDLSNILAALNNIQNQTDQLVFINGKIKSTLDGEKVDLTSESAKAARAKATISL